MFVKCKDSNHPPTIMVWSVPHPYKLCYRWDFIQYNRNDTHSTLSYKTFYTWTFTSQSSLLCWQSIAISVSVCLLVCLSVSLLSYLKNHWSKFLELFCTFCLWPWLRHGIFRVLDADEPLCKMWRR